MIDEIELPPGKAPMTRVRYRVLASLVALAGVTYLDRVCISRAEGQIRADLGLSPVQMGFVFSAFTIAYALFEMPTGAWGDRIGARRVLTRIVVWWSGFTIATAAAVGYRSLLAIRFLFGMGEAGAFPNASKVISRWFPLAERGTAQGIFFAGAHLGGGLTPMLVGPMLGIMSWRWVFVIFGGVGLAWAAAWFWWFRDEPGLHPAVGEGERKYIESGRLKASGHGLDARRLAQVLSDWNVVLLCLMYFTQAYVFYFNITWLPTYLAKARGFRDPLLGLLAGLPLILSAVADVTGGLLTDRLVRAWGPRGGRCAIGGASLLVAGVATIAGAAVPDPMAAALLLALAGAADSFLLGAAWSTCLDVAGPDAGLVTATMNSSGQLGGALSPIVLSFFLREGAENWPAPLYIAGGLCLAGASCWLFIDPGRPIASGDKRRIGIPELE